MHQLRVFATFALLILIIHPATAQTDRKPRTIGEATAGMRRIDGFVPLHWNETTGRLLMEVSRFGEEMLYQISLQTGVGSNPIGLDRGQLGGTHVVRFERIGDKLLLVEPTYRYRATTESAAERSAVEGSFAQSILWGFPIIATEQGRVLVDATSFFVRDAHGAADRLRTAEQGRYTFDPNRSAVYLPNTRGFPKNTEVEAIVTLQTDETPGRLVRETVPTGKAITVRQHHSLVELPKSPLPPRRFDPRVGSLPLEFYDYGTPIDEPLVQRWIVRHRLEKRDPSAAVSEPVEPIVYYVDAGTPEPIRSALVEGAAWWNEAFEAAGFRNAFQVRLLPADADPMDIRYNVISWVHRSTRGWAYGSSVVDPRTGEILKGNVTLDSQRARQDHLILSGLTAGGAIGDAEAAAVARIRQLSAHEVGHAIGLAHNFAASTYGRASVMDYPAPLVEIRDGRLDISNAYATGIGAYDKLAIRYSYARFGPGADEAASLSAIADEGVRAGMYFLSDADARPPGAAHPLANLWDNGDDPIARLRHELEVRRIALAGFDTRAVRPGAPLSSLEAKLLPIYLYHRYQLQAAAKSVGGVTYSYAVKTSSGASPASPTAIVSPERQRLALDAVLSTLDVELLALPERIVAAIPPTAFGYDGGTEEPFPGRTDPTFDSIAAATVAADLGVSALLERHRAARLVEFHARDAAYPHFREVLTALITRTFGGRDAATGYHAAIGRAVETLVVTRLVELASDSTASPAVRAEAEDGLRAIAARLADDAAPTSEGAHRRALRAEIVRFMSRPATPREPPAHLPIPAGDPIGN
jgi:hypothetical protein